LSVRGHRESLLGDSNPGNFLALFKYLAKVDPVMRGNLDSVSGKPGCLSYFFPVIQNELISLLEARVREINISSVQNAKADQIKENEVGRACGTHGTGEKRVQGFGGKARRKKPT
jgi:hypothetical protein